MKTKVLTDGFDGHVRRSLARAAKMERGERLKPIKIITFADPLDLLECLTAQRLRIIQTTRQQQLSISALALALGRNRVSVARDVNALRKLGLLRLREGAGNVQIVEPIAKTLEMHTTI